MSKKKTVISDLPSNPILDYWEKIKYRPQYKKAETLLMQADKIASKGKAAEADKLRTEAWDIVDALPDIAVNVSDKVYEIYAYYVRLLNDPETEWEYDHHRASHAINFIQTFCRQSKGKSGGKLLELTDWQLAATAVIFGFIHKITLLRKIRLVLLIVGRKNGKSTWASAVALYLLVGDGEAGPEVYAVATKRDQARIIWGEAKRMVQKSPTLLKRIKCLVAELVSTFNDGSFKALGRDSETLDGLNVHGATMDEIEAWTDDEMFPVVVDGMGAREQPLCIMTATAGTVRGHEFDNKYEDAETLIKKIKGENPLADYQTEESNSEEQATGIPDEEFFPLIYELEHRELLPYEFTWYKANPGLGKIKNLDTLRKKVNKALALPRLIKNLICKDFNIPETVSEAWLTFEQANNTATFDIKELKPRYGIGGTDLSHTTDLTFAVMIFCVPCDEHIYVNCMAWLPEDLIEERCNIDKIPYDIWVEQGYMRLCRGNKIRPSDVTAWFKEQQTEQDIYLFRCGYDGWSATYWVDEMADTFGRDNMIKIEQTFKGLSAPMLQLGADLDSKLINYNNNPILKWCLCNTSKIEDKNGNIKPCKTHDQRKRIDGLAALLDAYAALTDVQGEYLSMI